ncbi:25-hydroxycholesterol 7-alpha-hydroxylase [Colletotrichum tanaceti]|uniref:25-hydroxycholesterol 7-alpha-hydroxylase n=1 Tax=Colletotrichum tanaceti TaxID=1306861 RepID=A0A4U6XHN2_9PEZI|nr:25-hydroxycholesterol 7-alpha-hydroxylase [Colletotrichum tanaceti]TKW54939.1 25-hydroxycholesterol 7-alpha-hydroxylase [Colletotrichum tanaceti]
MIASGLEGGLVPFTALAAIPLLLFFAYLVANPVAMDPNEPPLARPTIPFIGHIIGLFQHSWKYFDTIHAKHPGPILTLPMLNGKAYIITDPDLAQSAIRNRALSFDPHLRSFVQDITGPGVDAAAMAIWDDPAFIGPWVKILYGGMAGRPLLALNVSAVGRVAASLNAAVGGGTTDVGDLYRWTRDVFTLASTDSLYGRENPLRADGRLVDAYWDYEADVSKLMLKIFPSLLAPRGHRGRDLLERALESFFAANHHQGPDVATLVRDRRVLTARFGMLPRAAASIELVFLHGAISNTFPAFYWLFAHVFSLPELLVRLREEARALIVEKEEDTGINGSRGDGKKRVVTLHVDRIEERCPLLMSCFRETHRLHAAGVLVRKVMSDTTISDGGGGTDYVLRKDAQVQAPQTVLQTSTRIWGGDAAEFVGDRFLKGAEAKGEAVAGFAPRGFLVFGGGKHICPGRFFASGELLGSMALLVSGFDFTDAHGNVLAVPQAGAVPLTGSFGKPVSGSDLRGRIRRRPGWEDVHWEVAA